MSKHEMLSILHDVLSVLQVCLGVWQFMKLTPVGALIQSVFGWLVQPLGLSPAYSLLQHCRGRVFKRANCFALQPDIPSDRSVPRHEVHPNPIDLRYLGSDFLLERTGEHGNTLSINKKMCYYITDTNWEKLQTLDTFLRYSDDGPPIDRAAVARAAADAAEARAEADAAEARAEADAADSAVDAARRVDTVFVKGNKEFWTEVITGGVMSFDEVCDALILHNQRVSVHLNNEWLLPVNLSVSEEKLLKILNLVALFLRTTKVNVHWAIPISLSIISALMEFSARLRVWIYSNINMLFCCIIHFICDSLPRSCRRHIYSLGRWVDLQQHQD